MSGTSYILDFRRSIKFGLPAWLPWLVDFVEYLISWFNSTISSSASQLNASGAEVGLLTQEPIQVFSNLTISLTLFLSLLAFAHRRRISGNGICNGMVGYWTVHFTAVLGSLVAGLVMQNDVVETIGQAGYSLLLASILSILVWAIVQAFSRQTPRKFNN